MIWVLGIALLIAGTFAWAWVSEAREDRARRKFWRDLSQRIDGAHDVYDQEAHQPCALCRLSGAVVFDSFAAIAKHNRDLDRSTQPLAGLYLIPEERS